MNYRLSSCLQIIRTSLEIQSQIFARKIFLTRNQACKLVSHVMLKNPILSNFNFVLPLNIEKFKFVKNVSLVFKSIPKKGKHNKSVLTDT